MIIYPPFIADTIPAFTTDKIIIPFSQNPAVNIKEVETFELIVKDYMSSKIIAKLSAAADSIIYNQKTKSGEVIFLTDTWKPQPKQYYKFQLGYNDNSINSNTGENYIAYSTASIGRCIGEGGSISITGLNSEIVNSSQSVYKGMYITDLYSEPVYSYRFILKNTTTNKIIQDTGDILHNVENDTITAQKRRITQHNFKSNYDLNKNDYYSLIYSVITINGYTISTEPYSIIKADELPMAFGGTIKVEQDKMAMDNGYVKISIHPGIEPTKGDFILERTSNNIEWNELTRFHLTNASDLSFFTWKDWSVEQGTKYTYGIRQYSGLIQSERKISNTISVDFQDMFLSDGERQLKIEYNPKVSSFKETILEQKTDTIGGKYPFFFRNGQVKYKEIPISGLISYWMDKDNLFISANELGIFKSLFSRENTPEPEEKVQESIDIKTPTTNLDNYNFFVERKFKLSVLEWLTNGKPKLFRSPAEGNYVVRLMNTSLSPNDALGRMLHTFSSTGYEIMDNTIDNLKEYGLMNLSELRDPENILKPLRKLDLTWLGEEEEKTFFGNLENIQWVTLTPDSTTTIKVNGEDYVNTTGTYNFPSANSITVKREVLERGDSIIFYEVLDLGQDDFQNIVENSSDILFSAPANYKLYDETLDGENNPKGILNYKDKITNEIKSLKIYRTYVIIASKDNNYISQNPEEDYKLTIGETTIDCSDGQIRYYYNVDPDLTYEKGLGLHLDIYARVQTEGASSRLGQFILGKSRLS